MKGNPVANLPRERHLVCHYQHGHAVFREPPHHCENLAYQLGVQGRGDLVQQQDFRVHRNSARNAYALLLTAGKLQRQMLGTIRQTHAL